MKKIIIGLPALLFAGAIAAGTSDFHAFEHEKGAGCASHGAMAKFHALHPHSIIAIETEDGVIFVDTRDGAVIKKQENDQNQHVPVKSKTMI